MDFHRTICLAIFFELRKHRTDVPGIVIRYEKERRRRISRNLILWNTKRAGIDHDLEVGATIDAIDGIGGVFIAGSWTVNQHRHHFATGGKAQRTDSVRIELPFGGAAADEPHGTLRILARMDLK